jgi:hypothetical protein
VRERIARLLRLHREQQPVEDRPGVQRFEERLAHLEALVEGLQDAVHRDAVRHDARMSELEKKTEPEALTKALSDHARRHGL